MGIDAGSLAGILSVEHGGTGSSTLTGLLIGNGINPVATAIPGIDYEIPLTFNDPLARFGNAISLNYASPLSLDGSNNLYIADSAIAESMLDITSGPSAGYVMQYDGSKMNWVSTSTLGLGGSGGSINSASSGFIAYYASSGSSISGTSTLFFNSSGQIGLNTTSPAYTLDINGNFRVTSGLRIGTYSFPTTDGSAGYVLKTDGSGALTWQADLAGSGAGGSLWATSSDSLVIYPYDAGKTVVIGAGATSAPGFIFEVSGSSLFDNITAGDITANSLSLSSTLGVSSGGTGCTSLTGMLKGSGTNLISVTGNTGYSAYWTDANTIGSEQYLATSRGGLGADISAVGAGELVYSSSATTYSHLAAGTLGNILVAGGASAPNWRSTSSLGISILDTTGILPTSRGGLGASFAGSDGFLYFAGGVASASNTISVARTDLAVSAPLNLSGNLITLDTTGDWTGTFDGQQGTYYLNAVNLTNFNLPFAANLSGTTTDALAQGTNNLYWSNTLFDSRFATRFAATTTDALAEGIANLYYTTARFAANLSGTTTDALTQGITNRYFTDILFDSRFGTRFSATTTDALAQGVNNLYWSNTLFDSRFGTRFAATTSDALAQGVNNLYWSNPLFDSRFATRFDATTTDALSEGNNNLYWLDSRFDTALLATTSVSTLLALPSLGTVGTITQGVWNGTAIDVTRGGTGLTGIAVDNIIYASAQDTYSASPITLFGRNLIDESSSSTARTALGINIGSDAQAYSWYLQTIANGNWQGSTTISVLGTVTSGAWQGTSIGAGYGGTGQDSSGWTGVPYVSSGNWSASSTLSPSIGGTGLTLYGAGDIIYASSSSQLGRRSIGPSGSLLLSQGGYPVWTATSTLGLEQSFTVLGLNKGGLGFSSITNQSLVIATAENTLGELTIGPEGAMLTVQGGNLAWSTSTVASHSLLSVIHADTDATTTLLRGDLLVAGTFEQMDQAHARSNRIIYRIRRVRRKMEYGSFGRLLGRDRLEFDRFFRNRIS